MSLSVHTSVGLVDVTAERLLNDAFGLEKGRTYFDDFPVWNDLGLVQRRQIIRKEILHGKTVVSVAMGRKAAFHLAGRKISLGLIGAVATSPNCRGQGMASRLVSGLIEDLFDQGCAVIALWGSDVSFYEKLGFTPGGEQWMVPLDSLALSEVSRVQQLGLSMRHDFAPPLFQAIKRSRLTGGLDLQDNDYTWMARHKGVTWAWLQNPLGGVSAYIGVGRGIDLPGVVHEWGGDPDALGSLLRWARERVPDLKLMAQPKHLVRSQLLAYSPQQMEKMPVALFLKNPISTEKFEFSDFWFWGLDGA
jgi:GNAT superfamily N-acetyltransferase